MNNVNLIGRITKDLEPKKTKSDTLMITFTLACKRKLANKDGEKMTDFFNCVAFGSRAEFLLKYAGKSTLIGIEGRLQSKVYIDEYEKRHSTVDVIVESVQILRNPTRLEDTDATASESEETTDKDDQTLEVHEDETSEVTENGDDMDKSLDELISNFSSTFF